MSNISQCTYSKCEKSNNCYRFLATPDPLYQKYNKFENICTQDNNYKWYWEVKQSIVKKEE